MNFEYLFEIYINFTAPFHFFRSPNMWPKKSELCGFYFSGRISMTLYWVDRYSKRNHTIPDISDHFIKTERQAM